MAHSEHVAILRQGVEVWNQWRKDNPDVRPDLREAKLIAANLERANLERANLYAADLSVAKLIEAKLIAAKLIAADLIAANLSEANLSEANLERANLERANLSEANLIGAYLREANLIGANLITANLERANLIGANLGGANLREANLIEANLRDANLRDADLRGAILEKARLIQANLREAIIGNTSFGDVDLSDVIGLETVKHKGPSTIGIDTIVRSKGNIPKVFLQGCGVPDVFIEYIPSLIGGMSPIEFYSCFISYSHANMAFARKLEAALQVSGVRVWRDEKQLEPGDFLQKEIDQAIRTHDKLILCMSETALKSWWVDIELDRLFDREEKLYNERGEHVPLLIPLRIDDAFDDWEHEKKTPIKRRLIADFTDWEDDEAFEAALHTLIKALNPDSKMPSPPMKI